MKCFPADADTISVSDVEDRFRESSHLKLHDRRGNSTKGWAPSMFRVRRCVNAALSS